MDEIRLMLCSHHIDVLCLTETFLTADISDGILLFPGYHVYRRDRAVPRRGRARGGGIVVLVKNDIGESELDVSLPGDSRVESLWLSVMSRGRSASVGAVCRPPDRHHPVTLTRSDGSLC